MKVVITPCLGGSPWSMNKRFRDRTAHTSCVSGQESHCEACQAPDLPMRSVQRQVLFPCNHIDMGSFSSCPILCTFPFHGFLLGDLLQQTIDTNGFRKHNLKHWMSKVVPGNDSERDFGKSYLTGQMAVRAPTVLVQGWLSSPSPSPGQRVNAFTHDELRWDPGGRRRTVCAISLVFQS